MLGLSQAKWEDKGEPAVEKQKSRKHLRQTALPDFLN